MYTYIMQLITITELRTKSKELVSALRSGGSADLIHRSRIIAELKPRKLNLPKLSYAERDRRYREAMMKKHGSFLPATRNFSGWATSVFLYLTFPLYDTPLKLLAPPAPSAPLPFPLD